MTTLLRTIDDLRSFRSRLTGTVALVPTMGALHDGHLTLVRAASKEADHVIVSDFVNPLQFGPGEDYERYPRDIEGDLGKIEGVADAIFAPAAEEMYPQGEPMRIDVGSLGTVLEGEIRPGHFSGVATVVTKLFNLVQPDVAVFGEKDAQQLAIIRRLVSDLNIPVRIVGHPIVREESGLARSSRNSYLSDEGKQAALALSALIRTALEQRSAAALLAVLEEAADPSGLTWDYKVAVDATTLTTIDADFRGEALILLAARVEGVRLIDNARTHLD